MTTRFLIIVVLIALTKMEDNELNSIMSHMDWDRVPINTEIILIWNNRSGKVNCISTYYFMLTYVYHYRNRQHLHGSKFIHAQDTRLVPS